MKIKRNKFDFRWAIYPPYVVALFAILAAPFTDRVSLALVPFWALAYVLTQFLSFCPGCERRIMKRAGTDGKELNRFEYYTNMPYVLVPHHCPI